MSVDWFTVAAQMVNFLLLVLLLRHFFYKRLLNAIDTREQRIALQLAEADQKNRQAAQDVERARAETERIQQQRNQMLAEGKQRADHEHDEMYQQAQTSVKQIETKWREDLEREKAVYFEQIRTRAAAEIVAIARRALSDLACADLQQCAVNSFLSSLPAINGGSWHGDVVIRSAAELAPATQIQIEEALRSRTNGNTRIRFECSPQMAWGVELSTNGTRIGWNPENYIKDLEQNLRLAFEHKAD